MEAVSRHIKCLAAASRVLLRACLADPPCCLLCDEVIDCMNRGKAVNEIYLSKSFSPIPMVP